MVPILDCHAIGLRLNEEDLDADDLRSFGEEFVAVFSSVGLCYLKNHGVDKDLIDGYMAVSRNFFTQPSEVKEKNKRPTGKICGWIGTETETNNPERPADLKEGFCYCPPREEEDGTVWPNAEFKDMSRNIYEPFKSLAMRLCDCLSLGLGLDKSFMRDAHLSMGKQGNTTALRTLFYPPILDDSSVKAGQIRLGEHTDFGTMTLLCQDNIGGLETELPGKGFVSVTPIPGTIVVNFGGLMQRWTADKLVAANHRVIIPEVEIQKRTHRQSIVFFVQPDDDYVIKPLDGSDKYKPITGLEYLMERFSGLGFNY